MPKIWVPAEQYQFVYQFMGTQQDKDKPHILYFDKEFRTFQQMGEPRTLL